MLLILASFFMLQIFQIPNLTHRGHLWQIIFDSDNLQIFPSQWPKEGKIILYWSNFGFRKAKLIENVNRESQTAFICHYLHTAFCARTSQQTPNTPLLKASSHSFICLITQQTFLRYLLSSICCYRCWPQ